MKRFLVYGLSNSWGGVETIVMSMISILNEQYEFDIIQSCEGASYEGQFDLKNVHFVHIPAWGQDYIGFKMGLKSLFEGKTYDYVWINGCIMANRSIISVTKNHSKAKIITHSHGTSYEEKNLLKRWLLLFLHYLNRPYYLSHIDYPCMCSVKSGRWFYGADYLNKKAVHFVKNGVVADRFLFNKAFRKEYRNKLDVKDDEIMLFHVGRLTLVKNQSMLLDIISILSESGTKIKLFIAGEGELKADLQKKVELKGIGKSVIFLGKRDDVNKLYSAADIMLLPSLHEGFPLTIVEAQMSGLPSIVSDRVSDETDFTGCVDYLPIEKGNEEQWAEAIKRLGRVKIEQRLNCSKKMIKSGFNIDDVCKQFVEFINS